MMPDQNQKPLPAFFIGKEKANKLITEYVKNKVSLIENNLLAGKQETRSIWYSLGDINELLQELQYLNADGVRFYFGSYPNDSTEEAKERINSNSNISGQMCLVIIPTFFNEKTLSHEDLIIEDAQDFASRVSSDLKSDNSGIYSKERDFNLGLPCPPFCINHLVKFPNVD